MGMTAGLAIMALGTGFSAYSSYAQGKYAKQVGEVNARVANLQSEDALQRGYEAENRLRGQVRRMVGTTRAAYAGQNVEVDTGTPVDVQSGLEAMGELDALTLRNNAAREAWGYKVQAYNYQAQGTLDRYTGNVQAVSTVLGSASNFYNMKFASGRGGGGGWASSGSAPPGYSNMGVGNTPRGDW